jgi:hypothetical protein
MILLLNSIAPAIQERQELGARGRMLMKRTEPVWRPALRLAGTLAPPAISVNCNPRGTLAPPSKKCEV